jgi:hypothetical protein
MMNKQPYDLIGDIHGQYDKLTALLAELGYQPSSQTFRHPEGRKVIFLGDYVDRGPKIRAVLNVVRTMVESGDALAIMGNHEYNAICFHTADGKGGHLRVRSEKNQRQHEASLAQFVELEDEWIAWVNWFKTLPVFLDLGGFRAVHACWDERRLKVVEGQSLLDDDFLHLSARQGAAERDAMRGLLNGPEIELPEDRPYVTPSGLRFPEMRVRWWDLREGLNLGQIAMPIPIENEDVVTAEMLSKIPIYEETEPPVFFGHYWMPADQEKAPLRHNIACLDYGAGLQGPLVAYRWDGERELCADKFVTSPHHE